MGSEDPYATTRSSSSAARTAARPARCSASTPRRNGSTSRASTSSSATSVPLPNAPQVEAGVIEREGPIHISNVQLIDPKTKKGTRVGVVREDGKRNRVARGSGTKFD